MGDYPKNLASSAREWKALKRRQMDALLRSDELDEFMIGSAFTPGYDEFSEAVTLLRVAREKMRVDRWGR